jgi:hypothetical protein
LESDNSQEDLVSLGGEWHLENSICMRHTGKLFPSNAQPPYPRGHFPWRDKLGMHLLSQGASQ